MDVHAETTFPAGPDEVAALFRDRDYVSARCAATGAAEHTADVLDHGASFTVHTWRSFPTDRFPSFARALVGDRLVIDQVEEWHARDDGSWHATTRVTTPAGPATVTAQVVLAADGAGSRETVDGQAKAGIPLVGSKVEKLMSDMVTSSLAAEHRLVTERLGPTGG